MGEKITSLDLLKRRAFQSLGLGAILAVIGIWLALLNGESWANGAFIGFLYGIVCFFLGFEEKDSFLPSWTRKGVGIYLGVAFVLGSIWMMGGILFSLFQGTNLITYLLLLPAISLLLMLTGFYLGPSRR